MRALLGRAAGTGRELWRAAIHPRKPTGAPHGRVDSLKELAAAGGCSYEMLRLAERIARPPPKSVDSLHPPPFERLATHLHPEVFRAVVPSARVAGVDPLVLTDDLRLVTESTFDVYQLEANPIAAGPLPRPRRLRGPHMLLASPWSDAYFHWMLDTLPRAGLLPLAERPDLPVLVPGRLTAFQRETLDLVGIAPERMVRFDRTHVVVDELHFPSFTAHTGNPRAFALEWLRTKLAPSPGERGRKLYVTRSTAASRSVVNEPDVVAMLAERGFEVFDPAGMRVADQLQLFSEANVIVGPHGAGLVNSLASRSATLVELFEPGYMNGCYYALGDVLGHDYWYLVCETQGSYDMRVDLPRLSATLDRAGA